VAVATSSSGAVVVKVEVNEAIVTQIDQIYLFSKRNKIDGENSV
jgi:hypothetical protein